MELATAYVVGRDVASRLSKSALRSIRVNSLKRARERLTGTQVSEKSLRHCARFGVKRLLCSRKGHDIHVS
jgi:hypothetical protein